MGVRVTDKDNVALYDSVSGTAFGPMFGSEFEAEDFLAWHEEHYAMDDGFSIGNESLRFVSDVRTYRDNELEQLVFMFRKEREEADGE